MHALENEWLLRGKHIDASAFPARGRARTPGFYPVAFSVRLDQVEVHLFVR
jgi:hypothetical protein